MFTRSAALKALFAAAVANHGRVADGAGADVAVMDLFDDVKAADWAALDALRAKVDHKAAMFADACDVANARKDAA